MTEGFERGDVFWAPDPFRPGANPRLWLVLAAESLPYPGEEYVCAALTTSDLHANAEVGDAWVAGRNPQRTSYCSPWVLATIKHRGVANPQGRVTTAFADRMVERAKAFLGP
ncbi:MAG TPA: hypothetical protein VKA37_08600 [Halobacteriales archaeon]|nr:hypothetical protein [Halobacteriales archaeon]